MSASCFLFRPPSATFPYFLRVRNPWTVDNTCLRTTCFFSPRSSLIARPELLSNVRPVSRLDSPQGLVSNNLVPQLPTQSSRHPRFHLFPGGLQDRSPLLLCDPGAGCTNTPHHTPHDFCPFILLFCVTFSQSTHTYGQSCILLTFLHPIHHTFDLYGFRSSAHAF